MAALSYEQALAFWYGLVNYEQRTPGPEDLKLDRMRYLLQQLGDPQDQLRIVHIAGSKGKGSTSAMLAAILRRAGYRTGLFTSPHLSAVEERIQIDDVSITRAELTTLMAEIIEVVASWESTPHHLTTPPPHHPTFFEVATALGFLHFARHGVDVAVVEVGLGGRFDSTNVCRPLVSLITSISFDHTQQLGNTLASIAMEKAGIIKPGRPALSGATAPEARQVIEAICRERGSPLRQLGVDFHYRYEPGQVTNDDPSGPAPGAPAARVQIVTEQRTWPVMELGLLGEHQAANAAVAVACVEQLRSEGLRIDAEAVAAGLAGVSWPARLEVVARRPLIVLDCAHNIASIEALVNTLLTSFPPARRLLVFAGSSDKDLRGIFRLLAPHFAHVLLTPYSNSPRTVPPERLAELLRQTADLPFTVCSTPGEAFRSALAAATADDLLCITGSVFLAGELRPLLLGMGTPPHGPGGTACGPAR